MAELCVNITMLCTQLKVKYYTKKDRTIKGQMIQLRELKKEMRCIFFSLYHISRKRLDRSLRKYFRYELQEPQKQNLDKEQLIGECNEIVININFQSSFS